MNVRRLRPSLLALPIGVLSAGLAVLAAAPQKGGIVPTDYHSISVDPGPEPDVTFFATGETLGKIEPCG